MQSQTVAVCAEQSECSVIFVYTIPKRKGRCCFLQWIYLCNSTTRRYNFSGIIHTTKIKQSYLSEIFLLSFHKSEKLLFNTQIIDGSAVYSAKCFDKASRYRSSYLGIKTGRFLGYIVRILVFFRMMTASIYVWNHY